MLEILKRKIVEVWSEAAQILAFLDQQMVFWTFAAIGIMSSLFLILTMVLGEVSDIIHDLFGGDGDHDLGGGDHGTEGTDHATDIHHDTPEYVGGNPSFFSLRFGLSFLSGFGVTGAIASHYNVHVVVSSIYGVVAGISIAGITYAIVRTMASQQASFNVVDRDLMDQEARVIVAVSGNGLGQVLVRVGEMTITKLARSEDGVLIPENSRVKIVAVTEQTVVVRKIQPIPAG